MIMKRLQKLILIIVTAIIFTTTKGQSFTNPILAGFYPYQSICGVGNDYYIVNSSFLYYRGVQFVAALNYCNQLNYATSNGIATSNTAVYNWFKCSSNDNY